ncbi:MAG TPA: DUF1700 domain-containing protein [Clostridiaceae bacterium]|jgi:uncharacterized membrane protein|nr:DUF1700 domain-containing protein [Clostridiaceae bacterium]
MTRNEFLSKLADELKKNNVVDYEDILSEYEQHFAFKMADGFIEEEIAAKLGNPAELASQFASGDEDEKRKGNKATTVIGLCFIDFFAGIFFLLLMAWEVVMAAFSICDGVIAACLIANARPLSIIPPTPWFPGFVIGLSLAALSVLSALGCIYFAAFIRQLMRAYGRFHQNTKAAASGRAVLPSLGIYPRLPAKFSRRIRSAALFFLVMFTTCFVLGFIISVIVSGSLEFWHAWGWFGYKPVN